MRISAPIVGDLEQQMQDAADDVADALRGAVLRASTRHQTDLRIQVTSAGLGTKLANAWRMQLYPRSHRTLRPAGLVFSQATLLHDVFMLGAVVSASSGHRYLAIPTAQAQAMGFASTSKSRKGGDVPGGQLRRAAQVAAAIARLGAANVRTVLAGEGRLLLVYRAPEGRARGRSVGRLGVARGTDVPLFLLIPTVRLPVKLDFARAGKAAQGYLDAEVATAMTILGAA